MTPLSTRSALLQALTAGPGTPSELIKRIRKLTDDEVVLHDGAVYPSLSDLMDQGFIISCPKYKNGKELKGKEYKLTGKGQRRAKLEREIVAKVFRLRMK